MSPAIADRVNIHPTSIVILGKNAYENTTGSATHNETHQEQVKKYAIWELAVVFIQTQSRTGVKISSITMSRVRR
jgi:hypothetical protein